MPQLTAVVICSLLAVLLASSWTRYRVRMAKLDRISTVGYSGLLSSYISAYKFIKHGAAIVQEGCTKYRGAAFKVPLMDKWIVIISNADMVEDFYRASEAQLSLQEAFRETFHADLVLDWVQVATTQKVLNIVCRMSNRVFVNLPLCRNEEWRAIVLDYATKVFTASQTINLFPKFLQPAVGWWINPRPASYRHAVKYLEPIILDRLQKEKQQGVDWDAPEDLLTWLLKSATVNEKERRDPANLILSILTVNMGAIHTTVCSKLLSRKLSLTSISPTPEHGECRIHVDLEAHDPTSPNLQAFTNAIFNLALRPELIDILRREIEPIVKEDGWTKNAMGKMRILDSFLKESQRYSSSFSISVQRKPLENFTFSNGTVVPAGTIIVASPRAIHFDENHYPNPSEFDAFRSYRMNEKSGNMKHQMATPETNYLAFGIGKHAWRVEILMRDTIYILTRWYAF
ncbi:cytochrome p450 [Moniliophthora roreri]|nr:cytochrome p450 [Moniliophthora roreri]